MANLASMFLNRGRFNGEQFLTPESIQTMHKPHGNQYWDGCSPLYTVIRAYSGLGFMIGQYHGIPTVGHTGGMQSFTTNFHLFPEQGLGLILLLNYLDYDTGGELHKRSELLFDLSHELLELGPRQANHRPALPSTLTAAEQARWPSYAGTYLGASDNSRGGLVEVYLAENNLMLETGGAKQILVPIGERQYYFQTDSGERESVAFLPDGRGQVRHMMISSDAYYRIAIDGRHAPNPDLWTAYEGIYEDPSQPEPRARHQIQIRLEDGKLLVRIQGREVELTPLNNALFLSEFGLLEFLVAEDGSASTLIVQGATPYHRVNADS